MAHDPVRWQRLVTPRGALLMLALDHGVSMGPGPGLMDPGPLLEAVSASASCVAVHKGLVPRVRPHKERLGVLLHLSASTDVGPDPDDKRLVATVQEALALGCDGVSVHVNLGSRTEARQLEDLGRTSSACNELGVPLVAMVYPRGPGIHDPHDPRLVAHAARLGMELGADAVKVPYTGSEDSFREVVRGAGVPVVVAGGPQRADFDRFLEDLACARRAGAAGASVGRNVFLADDPGQAMAAIAKRFE